MDELTDINFPSTTNIIEYNLNKWINFKAKHFESILVFLNRKNAKIRGPLDFHLGVSLCEKI